MNEATTPSRLVQTELNSVKWMKLQHQVDWCEMNQATTSNRVELGDESDNIASSRSMQMELSYCEPIKQTGMN
ncbi:YafY family transcriptional regulator [Sesbania bispinosa]|nr:YafY family transcriptional regulator [Sesbania bispinosa]